MYHKIFINPNATKYCHSTRSRTISSGENQKVFTIQFPNQRNKQVTQVSLAYFYAEVYLNSGCISSHQRYVHDEKS